VGETGETEVEARSPSKATMTTFMKGLIEIWQGGAEERSFLAFVVEWIRMCLVNSSEREKRFWQVENEHWWGRSPVWVRMWRVWCSRRWKDFGQMWHLYGRGASWPLRGTAVEVADDMSVEEKVDERDKSELAAA